MKGRFVGRAFRPAAGAGSSDPAFIAFAAVVFAIACAIVSAQQTPVRDGGAAAATGTATLGGVVMTDEATGRPLRRAVVTLNGTDAGVARTTITDDDGRFVFSALPAGRYSIVATKAAYVTAYYGGKRPGRAPAAPIPIATGQSLTNVTLKMVRGAVITGRVVDTSGRPAGMAFINALPVRTTNGERTSSQPVGTSIADERGIFRLFGLAPGEYVVSASPMRMLAGPGADVRATSAADLQRALLAVREARAGAPGSAPAPPAAPPADVPTLGYTTIYYPGTPDFGTATTVTVGPGDQRADIDFPVMMVRMSRVDGAILNSDGRPFADTMVTLTSSGPRSSASGAMANQTGKYSFTSLAPGQYTLIIRAIPTVAPGAPAPAPLWANMELTLDGRDVRDLALTMEPGATVKGRVVVEAAVGSAPPDLTRVRVSLVSSSTAGRPFGFSPPVVQPDTSGAFAITGVAPGKYRLTAAVQNAGPPSGWTLKSSALDGRDATELPVEIRVGENVTNAVVTLTDRATELTGVFRDATGAPTTDYMVVVFSTDRRYWTTDSRRVVGPVRPGADGRFIVRDLPPGEYFLAAASDVDPTDVSDAAFLADLAAKGMRITLAEGEKKTQDIKIAGGN